jgi:hypothetical protein
MFSPPTQTCRICGDAETVTVSGGFPPERALRRLAKRCKERGHACDARYVAGFYFDTSICREDK